MVWLPHALCLFAALTAASSVSAAPALAAPAPTDPPPSGLKQLWVVNPKKLSRADLMLAGTLQGLVNREQPAIWMRAGGEYAVVEAQLKREGVDLRDVSDPWDLLKQFRDRVSGAVLFRANSPSVGVATSLCGVLNAVAVDASQEKRAREAGLPILADARKMTAEEAWKRYRDSFTNGIGVEQADNKPGHLRDFAVAHRAFTLSDVPAAFRTEVARSLGPSALFYGWGTDESDWVRDLSSGDATGVAADWCVNLSALEKLPAGKLTRPRRPSVPTEDGVRYVAFVLSDGDNIQWLCAGFDEKKEFYNNPLRGSFPMTWEVSPILCKTAPRVLQHIYATATPEDGFVCGAGVPGYTFPHYQTDRAAIAQSAAPYLAGADLRVVSVLNANAGSMRDTAPILDLPEVDGILYKDWAPYNRRRGEIYWRHGKPCVSYRGLLWERLMEPEQLAADIATLPAAPRTDERSYAIVQVHAWSYGKSGGPIEAVRRAIALLPKNTRVVTADQLIGMLRTNFGHLHANAE